MRIEVGQDALGRWAWMIFDGEQVIASDDDYHEASLAMEDAMNHLELHAKSQRRKRASK